MKPIETFTIRDIETADEALAIVRCDEKSVALCISLKRDGDVEVVMTKTEAKALAAALVKAAAES